MGRGERNKFMAINENEIIGLLNKCLDQLREDASIRQFDSSTFRAWKGNVRVILINGLRNNARLPLYEFDMATRSLPMPDSIIDPGYQEGMYERRFEEALPNVEKTLENIIWQLRTFGTPYVSSEEEGVSPKTFIAHGPKLKPLEKLCRFLIALGVQPLVIEEEPSEGRSPDQQVEIYLEQADCAIVFGTADDEELKDGKLYPRRNVCIEIGRFQERFPSRIIYLLEEGASLPSNVSDKIYERFTQESMEEAFVKVVRELKAFGLLKTSRADKEQILDQ